MLVITSNLFLKLGNWNMNIKILFCTFCGRKTYIYLFYLHEITSNHGTAPCLLDWWNLWMSWHWYLHVKTSWQQSFRTRNYLLQSVMGGMVVLFTAKPQLMGCSNILWYHVNLEISFIRSLKKGVDKHVTSFKWYKYQCNMVSNQLNLMLETLPYKHRFCQNSSFHHFFFITAWAQSNFNFYIYWSFLIIMQQNIRWYSTLTINHAVTFCWHKIQAVYIMPMLWSYMPLPPYQPNMLAVSSSYWSADPEQPHGVLRKFTCQCGVTGIFYSAIQIVYD